jgi:hypothetical protein
MGDGSEEALFNKCVGASIVEDVARSNRLDDNRDGEAPSSKLLVLGMFVELLCMMEFMSNRKLELPLASAERKATLRSGG